MGNSSHGSSPGDIDLADRVLNHFIHNLTVTVFISVLLSSAENLSEKAADNVNKYKYQN